jgi:hypothetical protein
VAVLMLAGLAGCGDKPPLAAKDTALARRTRPVLAILVDGSAGAPAKDTAWVQSLFTYVIDEQLKAWPWGGYVVLMRCGDMTQGVGEEARRMQKRTDASGLARADAIAWVHTRLEALAETTRTKPYQRSELVACLREAGKRLNPASTDNVLLFLTDGAEWHAGGINCEAAAKPCALPAPDFTLPHATVRLQGCGRGFPAGHARHLQQEWFRLLERAGVAKQRIDIRV